MATLVDSWHRLRTFLWKSSEPVTRTILALTIVAFLASFFTAYLIRGYPWWASLQFSTFTVGQQPWTLITYPLIIYDPLALLFSGYWLWAVGGSLERAWSSRTFFRFFFSVSLVTALGVEVGSQLLQLLGAPGGSHALLNGLWMPLAALTVAWCLLNPEQVVLLGFILPIQGRHLMWLTVALTYFLFVMGFGAPWLGVFALSGVAFAYFYTQRSTRSFSYRLPSRRGPRAPTIFERAFDWLAFYWERLRRRRPWR